MIFHKPEVIGELNDAVCERFHLLVSAYVSLPAADKMISF